MGNFFGSNLVGSLKTQNEEENLNIRIDLADDEDYYYLYADVPGKNISDIKLKFKSGDKLSIRIIEESEELNPISNKTCSIQERVHDEMERIIEFEESINKDSVNARLENGLLIVEIAKRNPDYDEDDLIIIKN